MLQQLFNTLQRPFATLGLPITINRQQIAHYTTAMSQVLLTCTHQPWYRVDITTETGKGRQTIDSEFPVLRRVSRFSTRQNEKVEPNKEK